VPQAKRGQTDVNPLVASYVKTCEACPEQYEGTLTDGRIFYFSYSRGQAFLGIGRTLDEAVHEQGTRVELDKPADGMFDSEEQRNKMFAELFRLHESRP
jgi:hypothetical protein